MLPDGSASTSRDPKTAAGGSARLSRLLLSTDPRRRIRIAQWWVAAIVYLGSTFVVRFALRPGIPFEAAFATWCGFLVLFLSSIYVALRSGWSERFSDPALTSLQMVLGVIGVIWAYLMCGAARGLTLYPLLLIFAFGAFSLSLRKIMWLTLIALLALVAAVASVDAVRGAHHHVWPIDADDTRLDLGNLLMISIVLPALSLIAGRFSILRSKLHAQREALSRAMEQVQQLATHDDLTGLFNRRYMQQRLEQELLRFQHHGNPYSVAVIDLDFFKRINDTQGHAFGDRVLQAFAAEAMATLRPSDLIARWGGEEFLVLLPHTAGSQGAAILQRLLARMHSMPHGTAPPLTFSAGVSECRRDETVGDAVARADAAMYEAKACGRNTVRLVAPAS